MSHCVFTCLAAAVMVAGCATRRITDWSPYYPKSATLRDDTLTHLIPTNAPFGSVFEIAIYLVEPGDTLAKILERFHVTAEYLASLNGYEGPDSMYLRKLKVGQRLVIYEQVH